ncbi:MAG: YHYH protein [Rhodocyclaceae bacterium]
MFVAISRQLSALLCCAALTLPAQAHGPAIPVGDGKLANAPRVGYLFTCMRMVSADRAGARGDVPWIRDGMWYPDEKLVVNGQVRWPNARLSIAKEGERRVIRTNDLPNHTTGVFPVAGSDPAARWDPNPNSIREQDFVLALPVEPQLAREPSCVGGEVGILNSGVLLFNAVDAGGRDAVAHEIQDSCNGHPQRTGQYHYHGPSTCIDDPEGKAGKHSSLLGYAFDGFGIYGTRGENGKTLRSADLDECHGHSHAVMWEGSLRTMYHYHLSEDFPYSVGCYRGTPAFRGPVGGPGSGEDGRPPRGGPDGERRGPPPGGMPPPRP